MLSWECALERKGKRENSQSKIGGKEKEKRNFPIKDWWKKKRKEKIPNQRLEERKRRGKWDYFSLHVINQRQASLLTRKDRHGHLCPLSKINS